MESLREKARGARIGREGIRVRQERKERVRAKSKSRSGRAKPIGKIAERRI